MRWLFSWLLGLIIGIGAGCGVLYFNPLTNDKVPLVDGTALLRYEIGPESLALTHGDRLTLDLFPRDIPTLWESTLVNTALVVVPLQNLRGETVALASRLSKLSAASNPLTKGVLVDDHWLITTPGAGSYFIQLSNNVWPLVRDTAVAVNMLNRPWTGDRVFHLTQGPSEQRAGIISGATGRFSNVTGTATETILVNDYVRPSQMRNPYAGELSVNLVRPAIEEVIGLSEENAGDASAEQAATATTSAGSAATTTQ